MRHILLQGVDAAMLAIPRMAQCTGPFLFLSDYFFNATVVVMEPIEIRMTPLGNALGYLMTFGNLVVFGFFAYSNDPFMSGVIRISIGSMTTTVALKK